MSDEKTDSGGAVAGVIGAIAVGAVFAAGMGVVAYDTVKDAPQKTEAHARAAGVVLEYNVFPVTDEKTGTKVYVAPLADGGFVKLDQSPCARRPEGVDPKTCTRRDGSDPGDENTMQSGTWTGVGCVRTACVIVAGEKPETGEAP